MGELRAVAFIVKQREGMRVGIHSESRESF